VRIVPLSLALLLAAASAPHALRAQGATAGGGGPDAILIAAARHLRSQAPSAGVVAIDPRVLNDGRVPRGGTFLETRPSDQTQRLAAGLGAKVHEVGRLIACGTGEARWQCRLSGVDLAIGLAQPTVHGTVATVAVSSWRQWSTRRGPRVSTQDEVLTLELTARGWQVTKAMLTRIT
jgi:hypothetical protein